MNYATEAAIKRKRIDWCEVLDFYCNGDYYVIDDFNRWCRNHKKVRSDNKRAYCYLLKINGRDWICNIRKSNGLEGFKRIVKDTKWIKEIDE